MDELLDRVNKNDSVIGTTTKTEAHEKGYAHRVATVYMFTNDNKLLVQLRKKDGLLDHSAAGHVKSRETYDDAAARELQEELGIASPIKKLGIFYADERMPRGKFQVIHWFGLYEAKLDKNQFDAMVLQEDEVINVQPFSLEEIIEQILRYPKKFTTGFKFTLNFFVQQKGLKLPKIPII